VGGSKESKLKKKTNKKICFHLFFPSLSSDWLEERWLRTVLPVMWSFVVALYVWLYFWLYDDVWSGRETATLNYK
jgi:hypothetical protein